MAIECPIIAFIASLVFVTAILNTMFLYFYIMHEIYEQPVLSGDAKVIMVTNNIIIQIRVIHEGGELVKLNKITLYTDIGIIECEIPSNNCTIPTTIIDISINLLNIDNNGSLYSGSIGYVLLKVTTQDNMNLFSPNKEYSIILHLDKELMIIKHSLTQSST